MTEPNPEPTTECPPWCAMHIDGRHVGELDLAKTVKGRNIYVRPVDFGEDQIGLQVIVDSLDGSEPITVEVEPAAVTESAWMADLQRSITAMENGQTPEGDAK